MHALEIPDTVAFGPFLLEVPTRSLFAGGEKIALSSRAFDILALLVNERARVVSKDEIIATVWRGLAVEENNLAVQISALRRALAEHAHGQTLILTVPGQGYRFVGKVDRPEARMDAPRPDGDGSDGNETHAGRAHEPAATLAAGASARAAAPPPHRLQRPAWPVLAVLAVAVPVGAALVWHWTRAPEAPRLSIAVLPFRNLSTDRTQDYLADAISDDLTTDLAHIPGSVVIARESSDMYKGHPAPARDIGRALNVRYLLEGSLRLADSSFSVNAQLIDAASGAHLWATLFTVPRDKLRDAQTMIVGKIGSALNVQLVDIESRRSMKERQRTPDSEDLYLQARSRHNNAANLGDLVYAQALLEKALVKSPDDTAAIVELSLVLLDKVAYNDDPDEAADFNAAKRLAGQALALSPRDDTVLTAAGRVRMLDDQLKEAEESFRAAIDINTNNVLARMGLVGAEFRQGRFESAWNELQIVVRLDPQGAKTRSYHYYLGVSAFMTGHWPDAVTWLQRSLAEGDSSGDGSLSVTEWSTLFLIATLENAGEDAQARTLYAHYRGKWPNRSVWRLSSYFWKPQVDNPGFQAFRDGLQRVGMPLYARVPATATADPARHGDFDPAPPLLPGSTAISAADLPGLRNRTPRPLIIDVGTGSAMLPGSLHVPDLSMDSGALPDTIARREPGAPVILVGAGWYGWSTADAVSRLAADKIAPLYWLQGGEEALAESHDPAVFNSRVP